MTDEQRLALRVVIAAERELRRLYPVSMPQDQQRIDVAYDIALSRVVQGAGVKEGEVR